MTHLAVQCNINLIEILTLPIYISGHSTALYPVDAECKFLDLYIFSHEKERERERPEKNYK